MTKVVWGARIRLAAAIVLILGSMSCGKLTRQGQSSSYLIITALQGASGADGTLATVLQSDVVTLVNSVPTIFADPGQVSFNLGLKDAGSAASPTAPTTANRITVDRYHVAYVRADGRNTPGVDVPFPVDGAFTVTVATGAVSAGFTLVRLQAKEEAPLKALAIGPVVISTIAEVTFYGHDQTGREVSATGRISVDFANWADPQ